MISGKTSIFGIFGHPVEHSFSPGMHNAAFAAIGLDGCYVPFAVHPDDLGNAVKAIVPLGFCGLNITIPHKEKVIPLLDDLTDDARLIGAVNTIEVRDKKLIGHNTDGKGFLRSLREETGFRPKGKTFLMVGSGGAARAVCFELALAGAGDILLHDIDRDKAGKLGHDIRSATATRVTVADASSLRTLAPDADCLINATPLGLKKSDPLPLSRELMRKGQLVCDLVYNPPDTRLLRTARSRGAKTLRGIGMLLYQGVIAFEIWTGKKAPASVMRKALARQMRNR
ncbi:MAG: shikimate dehydrogenase [Nitrospirae bacterium]|nr:shikimate dehydrogenase [Nitrospirota bacterium]NTW67336.1 shikimate dehydrogenase [Nitrospirota bacterium]